MNNKIKNLNEEINKIKNNQQLNSDKEKLIKDIENKETKIQELNLKMSQISSKYIEENNKLIEENKANNELLIKLRQDNQKLINELNENNKIKKVELNIDQFEFSIENKVKNIIESLKKEIYFIKKKHNELNINYNKAISDLSTANEYNAIYLNKISSLTNIIQDLKATYDKELKENNEIYIKKLNTAINEKSNIVEECSIKEKENFKKLQKAIKEKEDYEELIIKQDFKLNDLSEKYNQIEIIICKKNNEIKKYEEEFNKFIDVIEEQKKHIYNLNQEKKLFVNLEAELNYLNNYIDSLKNDSSAKNEIIRMLKNKVINSYSKVNKLNISSRSRTEESKISCIRHQINNNVLNVSNNLGLNNNSVLNNNSNLNISSNVNANSNYMNNNFYYKKNNINNIINNVNNTNSKLPTIYSTTSNNYNNNNNNDNNNDIHQENTLKYEQNNSNILLSDNKNSYRKEDQDQEAINKTNFQDNFVYKNKEKFDNINSMIKNIIEN